MRNIFDDQQVSINYQQQLQQGHNKFVNSHLDYEIERSIRLTIQQDRLQEYDNIINEAHQLLNQLLNQLPDIGNSLQKDALNIYLTYNGKSLINTIDNCQEIEQELYKVFSREVSIIKNTDRLVETKRNQPQKIYLPIFLIKSKIEPLLVFDIYDNIKDNNYSFNFFTYTQYLQKRLEKHYRNEEELENLSNFSFHKAINIDEKDMYIKFTSRYFIKLFLKAFTLNNNSEYIEEWITYFFKTLRRVPQALVLIGNKDVSEEIFYTGIIKQIFGHDYCLTMTDIILENQSIDMIIKNKLFIHINHIPEDEKLQKKLKDLIEGLIVYKGLGSNNIIQTPYLCQIIFTLDAPHPFLNDFLSLSKVFFIDSMENINLKLNQPDRISLLDNISKNLINYSQQLASLDLSQEQIYNNQYIDITQQEVLNQRVLHSNSICINDTVTFKDKNYKTDNELFKEWLKNPELMELALSNNSEHPILDPFHDSFEKILPKEERYKHTYITGQTGSGKSELLKTLMKRDIENDDCSVILFDIHGDLADGVSKLVTDKERLIYIDPLLNENKSPTINLFNIEDKSENNIARMTKVILSVLKDVNTDEQFSGPMEDVLINCIPVVLRKKDGDFEDLYRFMNDKNNADLIELGIEKGTRFESEFFSDYFKSTIQNSSSKSKAASNTTVKLKTTKDAVRRRIRKLISDPLFYNLMNGKGKIDLEKMINTEGKIIIFKIPIDEMQDTYIYYVRFLIGLIQIIALKRKSIDKDKRCITHLYIDEFHNFITPTFKSILAESRKFNLFLTMAHQSISQLDNAKLIDIILSNTNVKIIGKNNNKTLDILNKTLNKKLEDVELLPVGIFYLQYGNKDVLRISNTDKLLDDNMAIESTKFEEYKQYQLDKYYRELPRVKSQDEKEQERDKKEKERDKSIDKFIDAIKELDKNYFKVILDNDNEFKDNFSDTKDGADGYITQPKLADYFNILHSEYDEITNDNLLKIIKEKDIFFKKTPDDNSKKFGKKRYKIILNNGKS